jgi:putative flippase GtrA
VSSQTTPGRWVAQLGSHSAPRFVVVGGLSLAADIAMLALLHGVLAVPLLVATTIAFTVASIINFSFNRQWVFEGGRHGRTRKQLIRFYALVGLNLVSTLLITGGLSALGLLYLNAKLVAVVVNAVANYFLYRAWVFK